MEIKRQHFISRMCENNIRLDIQTQNQFDVISMETEIQPTY